MVAMAEDYRIDELSERECWELLSQAGFGRIALAPLGEPDIFPVNFLVDGSSLLMRTAAGTKLADVVVNASVAVEADAREGDEAWSVIAKGRARIVDSFRETYEKDELHLETWVPGDKPIYVEIAVDSVSGRRFFRGSAA